LKKKILVMVGGCSKTPICKLRWTTLLRKTQSSLRRMVDTKIMGAKTTQNKIYFTVF